MNLAKSVFAQHGEDTPASKSGDGSPQDTPDDVFQRLRDCTLEARRTSTSGTDLLPGLSTSISIICIPTSPTPTISLFEMPEEVHETIVQHLLPRHRRLLMQVDTWLWKQAICCEICAARARCTASKKLHSESLRVAEELNETDLVLLQSVMQLARDAVKRFTMEEYEAVARSPAALQVFL